MSDLLEALKSELESFGKANDETTLERSRRMLMGWWTQLRRVLRSGGLLVVDNAISHLEQMAPFAALVKADGLFTTSLVPVGNGEFLALKALA